MQGPYVHQSDVFLLSSADRILQEKSMYEKTVQTLSFMEILYLLKTKKLDAKTGTCLTQRGV